MRWKMERRKEGNHGWRVCGLWRSHGRANSSFVTLSFFHSEVLGLKGERESISIRYPSKKTHKELMLFFCLLHVQSLGVYICVFDRPLVTADRSVTARRRLFHHVWSNLARGRLGAGHRHYWAPRCWSRR